MVFNRKNIFLSVLISVLFLGAVIKTYAVPSTYFTAGQTLDPVVTDGTCAPGVCSVYPISIGDTVGSGTSGSIPFINSDGELEQDNAAFFWDQSTDRLGIGDNTPQAALTVGSGDAFRVTSAGAVTATGINSSGSIIFSGISTGVVLSSSGTLSSSLGTANQFLGVNSAGTANEYKTFSVGTSGTDFAVAHGSGTITFNLPTASASNRGALSSADWSTFNSKADDFLDLSDSPDSYTSQANKLVSVNSGASALNFVSEIAESGTNFRIGTGTQTGNLYNTVVGIGSKVGTLNSHTTYIGYNINSAGSAFGDNVIIGGSSMVVNADNMVIAAPTLSHARIGGMIALGDNMTLPTSGSYNGAAGNAPIYIGYGINNSETTVASKGNIFIGRNISTSGFTSNATTKAIVIAQDPTLENGMQNSVVIGADTSVLDAESNVTVIGNGATAYLDSTYGSGGGDGVAIGRNTKSGSWRATALGSYAQALAVSSTALGYGAYTNSSHGIAIGRGSYNDIDDSVVIQPAASTGSTNLGTVYLGAIGSYWTNPAMPSTETIDLSTTLNAGTVISRITGASGRDTRDTPLLTNIRGGHLRILGGQSTGTAEGGDIQFAVTPAGGASNNTLNSEFVAGAFKSDKKFYLYDTPNNDDALTQVLVRDSSTGEIMYRDSSSLLPSYPIGVTNGGTGTSTEFTSGSVVFAGSSGIYAQDNSNFFFDNSTNKLGIGTNSSLAATLHVKGSTSGSGTSSLLAQNSSAVSVFEVVDNGNVYVRNNSTSIWSFSSGQLAYTDGVSVSSFNLVAAEVVMQYGRIRYINSSGSTSSDFTNINQIDIETTFNPTSGTGQYTPVYMQPLINQTGGANGITAGIVINPTLTAAADWRSVYLLNSSGFGIYQSSSTAKNYFGGQTSIGTDTSPDYLIDIENSGSDTDILALTDSDGACLHNPEAGSETVTCSSDERLKDNINDAGDVLPYLSGFRIREYDVKSSGDHMIGVIAQEVMSDYPDLVKMGANGFYTVELPSTWHLVKGIQELDIKINDITSLDLENQNSLVNILIGWFADATNGIQTIFAKRVTVEELCVEDVCIDKDDLINILELNSVAPENNFSGDGGDIQPPVDEGGDETSDGEGDVPPEEDENIDPLPEEIAPENNEETPPENNPPVGGGEEENTPTPAL